jgi:hypothetical protein|tara:strand:- start:9447 stop:9899 length:453 start_codon:yes stop_codon:yes gene_type:complete
MSDISLRDKKFKVSDKVIEKIKLALNDFEGPRTTEGYERAKNLVNDPIISLALLKKINNFFRNADEEKWPYKLTGGDYGKKFFSILEDKVRDGQETGRKVKSNVLSNIYKSEHTKDVHNSNPTYVNVPEPDKAKGLREEVRKINKLINLY